MLEEEWLPLNGCGTCIRKNMCDYLGNCLLLNIDILYPDNNKRKRKFIQNLKNISENSIPFYMEEIKLRSSIVKENIPEVRLTFLEKLFIQNLNKKR